MLGLQVQGPHSENEWVRTKELNKNTTAHQSRGSSSQINPTEAQPPTDTPSCCTLGFWSFPTGQGEKGWLIQGKRTKSRSNSETPPPPCLSSRAAVTNLHKLGGFKIQKFTVSQFWRLDVQNLVFPGLVPSGGSREASFLVFYWFWCLPAILWLIDVLLTLPPSSLMLSLSLVHYEDTGHWLEGLP